MGTGYMGASAGPMSSFVVVLTVLCVGVKIASADPAACDANAASGRPDCVLDLLAQSDRK